LAIHLALPGLASSGELAGDLIRVLPLPGLASSGELAGGVYVGIPLALPALASSGELAADLAIHLALPGLASSGELAADLAIHLALAGLASSGELAGDLIRLFPLPALASSGELTLGAIETFNYKNPVILFFCTLTGAPDGLTDALLPISSFQCQHRSGRPSYLSVTIPGEDYNGAVTARVNGELLITMAKKHKGDVYHTEEIVRVSLEEIRPTGGGRNQTLQLSGHGTIEYSAKTVHLTDITYALDATSGARLRLGVPDIYLRPGDTVIYDAYNFPVDTISWSVNASQQQMEVAG
ncbi:MAG: hypothetical protein P1P81_04390, partial [Desulfobulbales bacterium]|nr:hypothetical protein [Desulfobulbales bacterium]